MCPAGMVDEFIRPNWPAPANVHAFATTRFGGQSPAPFDSLNLGDHVGDDLQNVLANRQYLTERASLPSSPLWLTQTHSTIVINSQDWQQAIEADAMVSQQANAVCVVMTADCLPILICDKAGTEVAAIHAGWRGLCDGIIENTLKKLSGDASNLMAWLGPAIGPSQFEVGEEVRDAFLAHSATADSAFQPSRPNHYLADIYQLAKQRLAACGLTSVYGGDYCTVSDPEKFFSYRRDNVTGRMASLIWLST